MKQFADRSDAGRELAVLLEHYRARPDVLVLGLPRGGVPVAFEVAQHLGAPLDVMIVRKLGAPGQPEFALGAVATGGITVINDNVSGWFQNSPALKREEIVQRVELQRRERIYRGDRPPLDVEGRTLILVDDGAATGASMLAAIRAARELGASKIVVALPVAPLDTCQALRAEADELVCANTPDNFIALSPWYQDFAQVTDQEVQAHLARADAALANDRSG